MARTSFRELTAGVAAVVLVALDLALAACCAMACASLMSVGLQELPRLTWQLLAGFGGAAAVQMCFGDRW